MQFTNNTIKENRGTFPLVRIESVGAGGTLNFTGNVIVNNTELETDEYYNDDDEYYSYYGNNNDDISSVVQLVNFEYPTEVYMSHNQFDNPDSTHELTVDLRIPFILDLGLNFWNQNNYSAVIQRYVCLVLTHNHSNGVVGCRADASHLFLAGDILCF